MSLIKKITYFAKNFHFKWKILSVYVSEKKELQTLNNKKTPL